jgi:integrase
MSVGRKPTKNLNLPKGVRARKQKSGVTYYYYEVSRDPFQEKPLGSDYVLAMKQWAELEMAELPSNVEIVTLRYAINEYFKSPEFSELAARTQKDYQSYAKNVLKFFDDPPAPLESIESKHIRQYKQWRKEAPKSLNKEKAFISLVWNHSRGIGLTNQPNPCQGVKGYKAPGRDIYVEDEIYDAVYEFGNEPLRDAMDIAYLIIQRPADTLKMSDQDIRSMLLSVEQNKTGRKLEVNIIGELKKTLARINARKSTMKVRSLQLIVADNGRPVSYAMLRNYFDKARVLAAKRYPALADDIKAFQFRDLRAKGVTDKWDAESAEAAQELAGHSTITTTQGYKRKRKGYRVDPVR